MHVHRTGVDSAASPTIAEATAIYRRYLEHALERDVERARGSISTLR